MILKRIEAYGFKSFAEKVEISFEHGITAIVGPNGSGKSNVADALRWVLGEQSARTLRGSRMEDIIFNGSSKRKALNIADVSIVLDNSDKTFPLDFSEISITRRMYRSGESEYYINKTPCRLKDVYDLLSGSGIGKDSMSIIGQNKADDILNSKPDERRLLFEDAAGIGKYKNRKREAQRKLDDTNANIIRIDDIIAELESQLEPLQAAATATGKYNELFSRLRGLKIDALAIKLKQLLNAEQQGSELEKQGSDELVGLETATAVLDAEKERILSELQNCDTTISSTEAKINRLNLENETVNGKIELERNRIISARDRNATLLADIARLGEEEKRSQDSYQQLSASKSGLQHEVAVAAASIKGFQKQAEVAEAAVRKSENSLEKQRNAAFANVQDTVNKRNNIKMLQLELDNAIKQKQKNRTEFEATGEELVAFGSTLTEHKTGLQICCNKIENAECICAGIDKDKSKIEEQIRQADVLLSATVDSLRKAQIRQDTLAALQNNHEGLSRAVKAVISSKESWHSGIHGVAGELFNVDRECATAVEIALGQSAQNIICSNDEIARCAIEMLKNTQAGRATFLPLTNIRPHKLDAGKTKYPGIIGIASELVKCDNSVRLAAEFLLGRTLVAKDFNSASNAAKLLNNQVRIVTLTGELLSPGGAITGGANHRHSTGIISRRAEIEALSEKINSLVQDQKQHMEKVSVLRNRLTVLDNELQKHSAETVAVKGELSVHRAGIDNIRSQMQRTEEKRLLIEAEYGHIAEEEQQINSALAECKQQLTSSEKSENDGQKALTQASEVLSARRDEFNRLQRKLNDALLTEKTVKAGYSATEERLSDLKAVIAANLAARERFTEEQDQIKLVIFQAEKEIAGFSAQLSDLKTEKKTLNENLSVQFEIKNDKLLRQEQIERDQRANRRRVTDIQTRLADIRVRNERNRVETENISIRAYDDFHIDLSSYVPARDNMTQSDKDMIGQLEKDILALGTINPNAIDEYQRAEERYKFLQIQRDDLEEAKNKLAVVIADMDEVMSGQFSDAVREIDQYFSEIFTRLFGGGSAALVLTQPDNLLETGVEVVVQIPGKRRQNMTLLSGGERALTVIALLFAMLQHRPSPFCVLDELDAALDEANVERFTEFLSEYCNKTQFVIITHRKRTMEVAEKLHGVTMEESGISQIVSVKFAI